MKNKNLILLVICSLPLMHAIAQVESDSDRRAARYTTANDYINHLRQVVKDYEACKNTARKSFDYYQAEYEIDGATEVVAALDSVGSDDRSRAKALAPLLRSSNEEIRAKATHLMGLLKTNQPVGVLFDSLLNDQENRVRAAKSLAELGESGVNALISALKSKDLEVMKAAAIGLGSVPSTPSRPDHTIVKGLADALYCKDNDTCDDLIEALANYHTQDSVAAIIRSLKDSEIDSSQITSAMAAIKMGGPCVVPLINLAAECHSEKEADNTTRWVAAILGDLGDPRAADVLQSIAEAEWALPKDQNNQRPEPPLRLDINQKYEDLPFWFWNKNLSSSILWDAAHDDDPKYDGSLSDDACAQACYALARLDGPGIQRLNLLTANTNLWVRARAIEGLMLANSKEFIKSPETVLALVRRFNDDDPYVNRIAHTAAKQITKCTTINQLYSLVVSDAVSQTNYEVATVAAKEYEQYISKQIKRSFETEDEDQRLLQMESFQGLVHPFSVFECLPEPRLLANAILKYKGIVMDSMLNSIVADYCTNGSAQFPIQKPVIVGLEAVQKQLIPDKVLLEFIGYHHHTDKGIVRYYGIMVIGSPSTTLKGVAMGEPFWIPLGPAAEIDASIKEYETVMRGKPGSDEILNNLWRVLLKPVYEVLPQSITNLIISPDSELSFVNMAALVDDHQTFVAQKFSIAYVSTGRDLLKANASATNNNLCIFSNPDFHNKPTTPIELEKLPAIPLENLSMRDYNGLALTPLPGTQEEMKFLCDHCKSWGAHSQVFAGSAASEAAIKSIKAPHILHVATHGFFLSDKISSDKDENRGSVSFFNPMERSGLAFAGAALTLEAWKNGKTPPTADDGILTAQEVATLNLEGTWLVTLSACDTGIGEAAAGEGVMGLRRGFVQAGAQNLLMALWPVSDRRTVEFMEAFYTKAMKTGDAPGALADVQRDMLLKIRSEKGALAAARYAGPFIMTFQGHQ